MSRFVTVLRDIYIRFLIWLGAAAPPGYEHFLPPNERPGDYTLLVGETIFSVARKFGVHYELIAQANGIENLESVQAGQTIFIPPPDWQPGPEPAEDETVLADEEGTAPARDEELLFLPEEETPEFESLDWLMEAEQTGEPGWADEEPTLLPEDTTLPTELPVESTADDEPGWLLAAEVAPPLAVAETLSPVDRAPLDKDIEWLLAPETVSAESQPRQEEASATQHKLPFESLAEEPVADEPPKDSDLAPVELPLESELAFRYIVQRGDTLSSIAKHFSVTVMALVEANDIADPNRIYPNQKLIIPGYLVSQQKVEMAQPPASVSPPADKFFVHTVLEDDTISSIAKKYGVTLRELIEANNIGEPSAIWAGQRLYIPGVIPQPAAKTESLSPVSTAPTVLAKSAAWPASIIDTNFPPIGPPHVIRAIYLSYFAVGHADSLKRMLQFLNKTEFNAVVIDVKGEHGWISYPSQIPQAYGIDPAHPTAKDFDAVLKELKARGVYTIARIVTFKDHPLATSRSDLSLKTTTGSIWQDGDNTGWSDPFLKPVWDYNIQIAVEAAQKGFNEIQFDYLRFPSPSQSGAPQYSQKVSKESRVAAIIGFLSAVKGQLEPFAVKIAADAFGYTCWRKDDALIGQDIERMAQYLDVLSPKLYPSSFGNGIPQYKMAVAYPYEVVFESAKRAVERVQPYGCEVRPWLQDFPDYRFDKRVYGKGEIQAQIQGCFDAGANGFMVWNPDVKYSENAYAPVNKN